MVIVTQLRVVVHILLSLYIPGLLATFLETFYCLISIMLSKHTYCILFWAESVTSVDLVHCRCKKRVLLCQDTEERSPSESIPNGVLRRDGIFWRGNAGGEHLQDGRPQIPLWHSGMQHNHWFFNTQQWVSIRNVTACYFKRFAPLFSFPLSLHSGWNAIFSFLKLLPGHRIFARVDEDSGRVGVPAVVHQCFQCHFSE